MLSNRELYFYIPALIIFQLFMFGYFVLIQIGEDHLGYPVFMVIAYPANKSKKGKRVRSVLHFHLMPDSRLGDIDGKKRIRTESIGMDGSIVNGEAVQDDKENKKLNRERMMTMFAAKLRDTWVHAITTTLFPDDG